jgi:hypothetical protein
MGQIRFIALVCTLALLLGLSVADAADCFDPVYCRGGSVTLCLDHCVGLSEKVRISGDTPLAITHPQCLVNCQQACSQVCGVSTTDADDDDELEQEPTLAGAVALPPPQALRGKARKPGHR